MSKASYDKLEDGSFSGKISQCPGVLAFGDTLYRCQQELRFSLEGWLIVKIRHGDKLPVIGNRKRTVGQVATRGSYLTILKMSGNPAGTLTYNLIPDAGEGKKVRSLEL